MNYCESRYYTKRRKTRVVPVGSTYIGGSNPIRIQSMTTTPTQDTSATLNQAIALAEAGCEIIRITAPNLAAAKALKDIREQFSKAGFSNIPLVADIHFLPKAALEALEHVEKVRVNPGNYADKKKFTITEYSDQQYDDELQRLYEAFSPLVLRAKTLGRTLRIGTNHGSLSDRILNRYGDTPLGMVESALEFVRIAESHSFHDIVLSLKASNPKVMIQAYRLASKMMEEQHMHYPFHLGVTEAGDGEDARIKSAVGIGSLLADGIGDTIRVSLTEDPIHEIPIAKQLAHIAHNLHQQPIGPDLPNDDIDPFSYNPTQRNSITLQNNIAIHADTHPPVFIHPNKPLSSYQEIAKDTLNSNNQTTDHKIEGLVLNIDSHKDLTYLQNLELILTAPKPTFILELNNINTSPQTLFQGFPFLSAPYILCRKFSENELPLLDQYLQFAQLHNLPLAIDTTPATLNTYQHLINKYSLQTLILTSSQPQHNLHAIGTYRLLNYLNPNTLIWIRNTKDNFIDPQNTFSSHLLEASTFSGNLLSDGIGNIISIESERSIQQANALGYNILQATRNRLTKTEFVACPSCGRTLFNLESTTQAIRQQTNHLKGVTIAIMGCIVNGPGEMADADFGYVGGAPGKINLYVGKKCVQYNIPQEHAVQELINLIKKHNKWVEPAKPLTNIVL